MSQRQRFQRRRLFLWVSITDKIIRNKKRWERKRRSVSLGWKLKFYELPQSVLPAVRSANDHAVRMAEGEGKGRRKSRLLRNFRRFCLTLPRCSRSLFGKSPRSLLLSSCQFEMWHHFDDLLGRSFGDESVKERAMERKQTIETLKKFNKAREGIANNIKTIIQEYLDK